MHRHQQPVPRVGLEGRVRPERGVHEEHVRPRLRRLLAERDGPEPDARRPPGRRPRAGARGPLGRAPRPGGPLGRRREERRGGHDAERAGRAQRRQPLGAAQRLRGRGRRLLDVLGREHAQAERGRREDVRPRAGPRREPPDVPGPRLPRRGRGLGRDARFVPGAQEPPALRADGHSHHQLRVRRVVPGLGRFVPRASHAQRVLDVPGLDDHEVPAVLRDVPFAGPEPALPPRPPQREADARAPARRARRALRLAPGEVAPVQRHHPQQARRRPGAPRARRRGRALDRHVRRLHLRGRGRAHHRHRRPPVLALHGPGRRGQVRRTAKGRVDVAHVRERLVHGRLRDEPGDAGRHGAHPGRHGNPHGELRVLPGAPLHARPGVPRAPRHVARRQPAGLRAARLHLLPLPERRGGGRRDGVPHRAAAVGRDGQGEAEAGLGFAVAVRDGRGPLGPGPAHAPRGAARQGGHQVRGERVDPHVRLRGAERLGLHGRVRLRRGKRGSVFACV
mmetsp:Transcript_7791/g.23156  ORF Transcript_7791/g.23156 Transcript_7791/m.23156 type:complete len:507 (-) Transcript_7791:19-1539(-)